MPSEAFCLCEQVKAVSAKLVKLQSLFGEDAELDVAAMLIKEPRLASTDIRLVARRLLDMRVSFTQPCNNPCFQTMSLEMPS